MIKNTLTAFTIAGLFSALQLSTLYATDVLSGETRWVSLFNGKNLDGWTIKIAGHPLGENFADTFRVEDGMIKASYDKYQKFSDQFGHLYSNIPYSHYILRLEYRFAGTVMADAPEWCNSNSGVMIHAQSPLSLFLEQQFPVSLECQFLANVGSGPRQTASVCTPGTNIEIDGKLITQHIVRSTAPVFPLEEWVKIEVEVHGGKQIVYRVNGKEALGYQRPQLDPQETDPQRLQAVRQLQAAGAEMYLESGHIALQAEGHPVWFRNIELLPLKE
jgi:3-keto-disaccharide hydrolase